MSGDSIEIIHIVIDVVLGIGLFYINRKASGFDELKKQVEHNATEIVDSKLRIHAAQAEGEINLVRQLFTTLKEEIVNSAKNINDQDDENQKRELKTSQQIGELKQYVVSNCASKNDVNQMAEQIVQLRISMGQVFPTIRRFPPPIINEPENA